MACLPVHHGGLAPNGWTGAMTLIEQCDYCGELLDGADLSVTISVDGKVPKRNDVLGWTGEHGYLGHFHTEAQEWKEPSCYQRVREAMDLAMSWGPTLENIETATPQWVGAQRRRMRRDP